jgi:ribosome maturation factor RimP
VRDSFPQSYTLIVSSPGIERPLTYAWQYRKHVGRTLVVKTRTDEGEVTGKLLDALDDAIILEVGTVAKTLRLEVIEKAIVKPPW